MKTLGYLIETSGRSLFVREESDILWAKEDVNYTVRRLVDGDEVERESEQREPSFEDYQTLAENLYSIHQEQLSQTKAILEDAVELLESIADLASKKTDNVMEMRGLLALIGQDCKKFLAPE